MMQKYAEARGLAKRFIVRVPVLTPMLSAYWVDLVTPISSGIAHPLIEGLRNEVICHDNRIDQYVPITRTPFKDAVLAAFSEETDGPGSHGILKNSSSKAFAETQDKVKIFDTDQDRLTS